VVAGFMAAFMSTYATQLNWGASYLVSDFYRRFLKRSASDGHYVMMSRVATVLLVVLSAYVSMKLSSIRSGWEFVLEAGAGTGGVYLLRWYWWRINAWSEISAMATALVSSFGLRWIAPFSGSGPVLFAKTAVTTTAVTTLVWVIVTLCTGSEPEPKLVEFYKKVRPDVRGWRPVAKLVPEITPTVDLGRNLTAWLLGCAMVYLALFGIGRFVLGAHGEGVGLVLGSVVCAFLLRGNLRKSWGVEPVES
jgi:Na+/proline symporter